jgi:xylulokinase
VQIAHTVRPNPQNKQVYDDLFGHYLDLYPATKDLQHHLAGLQDG